MIFLNLQFKGLVDIQEIRIILIKEMKNRLADKERSLIRAWIWQSVLFLGLVTPIFFLIAGDWTWSWGWVLMILLWALMISHPVLLIKRNPELLAERAKGMDAEGTKAWDKPLVRVASIAWFSTWILGAMDRRLNWTGWIQGGIHLGGAIGTGLGFALFIWAMVSNVFFAEGVRIQKERGHKVCDSGPYQFVRHPGYAGNILAILSIPLLLGSFWSVIPALLCSFFFILRTIKEDLTLKEELEGYDQYANQVQYLLLPGIW